VQWCAHRVSLSTLLTVLSLSLGQALIEARANVNSPNENGATALMVCCKTGHIGLVRAVLAHGAVINATLLKSGRTALHLASRFGHADVVRELLDRGANANSTGSHFTPLMSGSQNGHAEVVKALLDRGANANAAMLESGFTALMLGSQNGHVGVVMALLQGRAAINTALPSGATALLLASQQGHSHVVSLLLEQGADISAVMNDERFTAMIIGSLSGHVEVVKALLEHGASVHASTADRGFTSLMCASLNGHTEVVLALLERAANVNAASTDTGSTALMFGSRKDHVDIIVKVLLDRGASVNALDTNGHNALMIGAALGSTACVKVRSLWLFVEDGASLSLSRLFWPRGPTSNPLAGEPLPPCTLQPSTGAMLALKFSWSTGLASTIRVSDKVTHPCGLHWTKAIAYVQRCCWMGARRSCIWTTRWLFLNGCARSLKNSASSTDTPQVLSYRPGSRLSCRRAILCLLGLGARRHPMLAPIDRPVLLLIARFMWASTHCSPECRLVCTAC
jgi:ankyrin repeat protein